MSADLDRHALAYAVAGWDVHPLTGKVPRTTHGVLDASTDLDLVIAWWKRWPSANIGGRVPQGVVVVDIDPRNGGLDSWAALVELHGDIATRTAYSGRGDDGRHLYLRHPGGKLNATIGAGLDVKTSAGYTVLPPSIHPDTGGAYRWDDMTAPIATAPDWLARLLRKRVDAKKPTARASSIYVGDSVADWFTESTTWGDLLGRHGWTLKAGDGDCDGSKWQHPTADHVVSAAIRHGVLFVFSSSTDFDQTVPNHPIGYTRFKAFAILEHGGDMSAAARAARQRRQVAA